MKTIHRIKNATSTGRGKIIFLSILLVIVAAIAGAIWYWNTYKKSIIRNELKNAIEKKTKGLYVIRYGDFKLDEVNGSLYVSNLSVIYDSAAYSKLGTDDRPAILFKISVPQLIINGVKTPKALIDKEIIGNKVELKNPSIEIIYTNAGIDSSRTTPTKEVYEQILGDLDLIKLDTVLISGANITTRNIRRKTSNIELANATIQLENLQIDSLADADDSRLLYSKQLSLNCSGFSWPAKNQPYKYKVDSVSLQSSTQSLLISGFHINPLLGEDAFVKSRPYQDDRFDFDITNINIKGLDIRSLFAEKLTADTVTIASANFKIYRDLGIVRDKKNRVGTYPHQAIQKIKLPINIKRLVLNNTFVEYKERNPKTSQSGKVQFYQTTATVTNLTNDSAALVKNNLMTVDINTRFLNKASLKATWVFYLGNPNGRFDIKGTMGKINATDVNILTRPMGPAAIEDGVIKQLFFNFAGNNYSMKGKVRMLYEDLKISVLEKEEDSKKLKKKKLASFAANIFVKNANPAKKDGEVREEEVEMERDTNRSIFYLTWKSIFKGVKQTVGINK